jgi:hypothetical protein
MRRSRILLLVGIVSVISIAEGCKSGNPFKSASKSAPPFVAQAAPPSQGALNQGTPGGPAAPPVVTGTPAQYAPTTPPASVPGSTTTATATAKKTNSLTSWFTR